MDLIKALEIISQWDNPPLLADGANNWDVYGLIDFINQANYESDTEDKRDYVIEQNGIYELDSNGYLKSIPAYKFIDNKDD